MTVRNRRPFTSRGMSYDEQLLRALVCHQTSCEFDPGTASIPRQALGPAGRSPHFREAVERLAHAGYVTVVDSAGGRRAVTAVARVTASGLLAA